MDNEDFYDRLIAPALKELAEKCHSAGMNFIAYVEFAPGERGLTMALEAQRSVETKLVVWAARCGGNVDALISAMLKDARKNGHGSIYLSLLGVPASDDPKCAANGGLAVVTISKGS